MTRTCEMDGCITPETDVRPTRSPDGELLEMCRHCRGAWGLFAVSEETDRDAFEGARISNGPHHGPVSTLKQLYRAWRQR